MRIAFVIPRYGEDMVGGAETLAKEIIKHLPGKSFDVEVITTCAYNHFSWEDYFPPGEEVIDGKVVRRFKTNKRDLDVFLRLQHRINNYLPLNLDQQLAWVRESVNSDSLIDHISERGESFDLMIFLPYLFGVSILGTSVNPARSVLLPCLHDESYAYLDIVKHSFESVKGIIFNSGPEMELAKRLYDIRSKPCGVVGMGFDRPASHDPGRFRKKHGIEGDYLLYFGRKEDGKNTGYLVELFRHYLDSNSRGLSLVLAGSGELKVPKGYEDSIIDLDFLPQEEKIDACSGALAVCQPSVNESFSIVIMESWLAGRPVIVHAECDVTRAHCVESGGGLYFLDYPEFEGVVDYLRENPQVAGKMGESGRRYVEENYSWDRVISRFEESTRRIAS